MDREVQELPTRLADTIFVVQVHLYPSLLFDFRENGGIVEDVPEDGEGNLCECIVDKRHGGVGKQIRVQWQSTFLSRSHDSCF